MALHGSVVGVLGNRKRASLHAHRAFIVLLSFVMASPLLFVGGYSRPSRRESFVARHFATLGNNEALNLINQDDCVLLDLRLQGEQIQLGHLKANVIIPTVNIPVDFEEGFEEERFLNAMTIKLPDKHLNLLVSCSEGIRSKVIAKALEKHAYRYVYDLAEGVIGWREDGFPVGPLKGREKEFEPPL